MTASSAVVLMIKTLAILSAFLLIGAILRAKVKIFQKLYLPACVIGGALALILGPNGFNLLPISEEIMGLAGGLPSVLFVPIMAALPICSGKLDIKGLKSRRPALVIFLLLNLLISIQFALGLLVNSGFTMLGMDLYPTFGMELCMGFAGSHGQVGAVGGILEALNQPYYETAMGVTTTTATFGMLGGLIIGTAMINIAIRRKHTRLVKDVASMPREMVVGYYQREQEKPSMGSQTTMNNSIETITLHLGLLLVASGLGYVLAKLVGYLGSEILSSISTWVYAIFAAYILWLIIRKCKMDHLFDERIKNSLTGLMTDYLITAAILTIPVDVVLTYWQPLLVMCGVGVVLTLLICYFVCKKCINDYWFENVLGPFGMNTGAFFTGFLMLKMVDPDFKTPVLTDFSIGYTLNIFYWVPIISLLFPFVVSKGTTAGWLVCLGLSAVWAVLLIIFRQKGNHAAK